MLLSIYFMLATTNSSHCANKIRQKYCLHAVTFFSPVHRPGELWCNYPSSIYSYSIKLLLFLPAHPLTASLHIHVQYSLNFLTRIPKSIFRYVFIILEEFSCHLKIATEAVGCYFISCFSTSPVGIFSLIVHAIIYFTFWISDHSAKLILPWILL